MTLIKNGRSMSLQVLVVKDSSQLRLWVLRATAQRAQIAKSYGSDC
jgi:hypothetical protein